jgi:hypothetical protein
LFPIAQSCVKNNHAGLGRFVSHGKGPWFLALRSLGRALITSERSHPKARSDVAKK